MFPDTHKGGSTLTDLYDWQTVYIFSQHRQVQEFNILKKYSRFYYLMSTYSCINWSDMFAIMLLWSS